VIRNVTREIVKRLCRGGREASELAVEPNVPPVEEGARTSVRVPNRMRATVDVMATIETCVPAVVGTTAGFAIGGYNVPIMVPRLVMKASPGPMTPSDYTLYR
jgi:hypothetical protein